MNIADRIKILRERKGLSQKQLAHLLDMPNQSLSNYERGYRIPPSESLIKIANFFEVSVDYLLGRESFNYYANSPRNLREFLEKGDFIYDDLILTEKDMDKIRELVKMIVEYRRELKELEEGHKSKVDESVNSQ